MRRVLVLLLLAVGIAATPAVAATEVVDGGLRVESPDDVDRAAQAGVPWVSHGVSWVTLEPTPGSHLQPGGTDTAPWRAMRAVLDRARARGLKVQLIVTGAPSWASGREAPNNPPTPANVPRYADFLRDLAQEVGPAVDAYSPWNEPNLARFWAQPDAAAYVAILKAAAPAIRAADPGATVLAGPFVGTPQGWDWLNEFYLAKPKGSFDVLGWNMYPPGEPEAEPKLPDGRPLPASLAGQFYLRERLDVLDRGRPVWITEISWATCTGGDVRCVSRETQADYLTRAFQFRRRYLAASVERMFWYTTRDGADPTDWFDTQGLLDADGSAKPSYRAMAALAVETGGGTGPGGAATPLVPAALQPGAPAAARSGRGRVAIGRPRVTASRGKLTLRVRVTLVGGRGVLQVQGFRRGAWRTAATAGLPRTANVRIVLRDRGYVTLRVRARLTSSRRFTAARVVRVPARVRVR